MRRNHPVAGIVALLLALAAPARAELVELRIDAIEPFAGGVAHGDAGPYERVSGVARGELDPADPHNAGIALLDRAPRNARGRVEYEVDVFMLRPVGGSSTLLYDVTNRGSKVALTFFSDAARGAGSNDPRDAADVGDGFLLRRGYAVVWSGWDPTVPEGQGLMRGRFPRVPGLRGPVRDEWVFGVSTPDVPESATLSYPATRREGARLTVRRRETDAPRELPAGAWRWVDDRHVALVGARFEPALIYELRYEAADPPVLGIGFAAVRDLVSHLRHEPGAGGPFERSLAVGVSQSGRFLRHFLELGMNRDERDRRVFDGMLPYIAGSGKVFANHAFGQPGRSAGGHIARLFPESWFPFAHARTADPHGGGERGLLRGDDTDPLIIEANSSTEYWHKGASLGHTDPAGARDLAEPPGVRLFLISGTEHAGGALPRAHTCAHPTNPVRPGPALRALLVALEAWVARGTPPPASRVPRIADATLVRFEDLSFPSIPGAARPPAPNALRVPPDWIDPASGAGPTYPVLVPAVDGDGNEIAGLRLPPVAVPLATYSGWNAFEPPHPVGDLCGRSGSALPFPRDAAVRDAAGDPRAAIRERYPTHADYVERVRAASRALVDARLLLPDDAAAYLRAASADDAAWR